MKFGALLKKELSQLLNKQALISMAATLFIFIFMGTVMNGTMNKLHEDEEDSTWSEETGGSISLVNCDKGEFVKEMFEEMKKNNTTVEILSEENDMAAWQRIMDEKELKTLAVIPEDFSEKAEKGEEPSIKVVTSVTGTGLSNMIKDNTGSVSAVDAITQYLSDKKLEEKGITKEELDKLNDNVSLVEFTSANGKIAEVPSSAVSGLVMSMSMIMPFAVFFLLMMASSMIMSAISTEKIDKTLETLLSAPVSRIHVLGAKVLAAIITALLNAVVMMIGFGFYINGASGGAISSAVTDTMSNSGVDVTEAVKIADGIAALGLNLSGSTIALIFLELFITLAIGLCISLILGALASDAQSLQTLLMPVMFLVMIPFFVSIFMDMNSMNIVGKVIMFIIPFTHAYTAAGNIIFGHTGMLVGGLIYQLFFLAAVMYAAVKVFTTDLLFTMKLPESKAAAKKTK